MTAGGMGRRATRNSAALAPWALLALGGCGAGENAGVGDASANHASLEASAEARATASCGAADSVWTLTPMPSKIVSVGTWRTVTGSGSDNVWVVGPGTGEAHRFNGVKWTDLTVPGPAGGSALGKVLAFGPDDVLVGESGSSSVVRRWNGSTWVQAWAEAAGPLWFTGSDVGQLALAGTSGSDFFVGGSPGDGSFIEHVRAGATPRMVGPLLCDGSIFMAQSSAEDIFAIDAIGDAAHYDGTTWSQVAKGNCSAGNEVLNALASVGPGVALAVGGSLAPAGRSYALRLTTEGTSRETLPPLPPGASAQYGLVGAWAAGPTAQFAVSDGGFYLFNDGSGWKTRTLPKKTTPRSIWGSSATNVFIAADEGVWHCAP